MTIGIALTNGKDSIALTDSRASGSGRQTDSVNKMGEFNTSSYSGVIFGTGSANHIEAVIRNIEDTKKENLEEFVHFVHERYKNKLNSQDKLYLNSQYIEIMKKADLIQSDEDRDNFTKQRTTELMFEYDKSKREQTYFMIVAHDDSIEKIRLFHFNQFAKMEVVSSHVEIGAGADGGSLYLGNKLQGLDSMKLEVPDLAFFALNAYSQSTINQGVGGTPKIASIGKQGCIVIPTEKTIVLANVSGAYLSELPNTKLNHNLAREIFADVLSNDKISYRTIAKEIGLNVETLLTTYIPYSSWQERANRKLFKNGR